MRKLLVTLLCVALLVCCVPMTASAASIKIHIGFTETPLAADSDGQVLDPGSKEVKDSLQDYLVLDEGKLSKTIYLYKYFTENDVITEVQVFPADEYEQTIRYEVEYDVPQVCKDSGCKKIKLTKGKAENEIKISGTIPTGTGSHLEREWHYLSSYAPGDMVHSIPLYWSGEQSTRTKAASYVGTIVPFGTDSVSRVYINGSYYWYEGEGNDVDLYTSIKLEDKGKKLISDFNGHFVTNNETIYYSKTTSKGSTKVYSLSMKTGKSKTLKTIKDKAGTSFQLVGLYNNKLYYFKTNDPMGKGTLWYMDLKSSKKTVKKVASSITVDNLKNKETARYIYCTDYFSNKITIFDCKTNKKVKTISSATDPAVDGGKLYYIKRGGTSPQLCSSSLTGKSVKTLFTVPEGGYITSFDGRDLNYTVGETDYTYFIDLGYSAKHS